jgi:hypothetical protein
MEILSTHSSRRARHFVAEERARYDWPSIYLDTSIVSYLKARLNRHLISRALNV